MLGQHQGVELNYHGDKGQKHFYSTKDEATAKFWLKF